MPGSHDPLISSGVPNLPKRKMRCPTEMSSKVTQIRRLFWLSQLAQRCIDSHTEAGHLVSSIVRLPLILHSSGRYPTYVEQPTLPPSSYLSLSSSFLFAGNIAGSLIRLIESSPSNSVLATVALVQNDGNTSISKWASPSASPAFSIPAPTLTRIPPPHPHCHRPQSLNRVTASHQ